MNRISLTDLAKNEPMEPLLEKEVQVRAHELYEQRGKGQGFALHDWLEAEAEVLARFPQPPPPMRFAPAAIPISPRARGCFAPSWRNINYTHHRRSAVPE
jgi:hypothetical protein